MTTCRHIRDVEMTFALSTESRRPLRPRASSKARRATRATSSGWYSSVSYTYRLATLPGAVEAREIRHQAPTFTGRPRVRVDALSLSRHQLLGLAALYAAVNRRPEQQAPLRCSDAFCSGRDIHPGRTGAASSARA